MPSSSSTVDLAPDAGVAGVGPRIALPRVVAELAGPAGWCGRSRGACRSARRSRGRSPFRSAGSWARRRTVRRADDDDVARDDGRGVEPDLAGDEIHLLVVFQLEIDDAVLPEAGTGAPVFASSAIIW